MNLPTIATPAEVNEANSLSSAPLDCDLPGVVAYGIRQAVRHPTSWEGAILTVNKV